MLSPDAILRWVDTVRVGIDRVWPQVGIRRQERSVSWTPPEEGEVAVHCDGSKGASPGTSGFGGCLRDSRGGWLVGFWGFGGSDSVLCMELMAIFHGLSLAWDNGFRRVLCLSDSLLAVNLIQTPPSSHHVFAVVVGNICGLLRRDWRVCVQHTLREGNACADFLAKAGAAQAARFSVMGEPPPGLTPLLLADVVGTVFVRR